MPVFGTGFDLHKTAMPKASQTLDDISQQHTPSRWLEEAAAQPRPAQQLGTLGGGNHFLEVMASLEDFLFSTLSTKAEICHHIATCCLAAEIKAQLLSVH